MFDGVQSPTMFRSIVSRPASHFDRQIQKQVQADFIATVVEQHLGTVCSSSVAAT